MLKPSVPFLPDTPIFGDQECIRLSNQEKKWQELITLKIHGKA